MEPHILILEDEILIALDMEDTLASSGQKVVVTASCAEATVHLAQFTPTVAVLDLNLRDGKCTYICRELTSRNVPVIVASGAYERDADDAFRDVIWLPKPSTPDQLLEAFWKAQQTGSAVESNAR